MRKPATREGGGARPGWGKGSPPREEGRGPRGRGEGGVPTVGKGHERRGCEGPLQAGAPRRRRGGGQIEPAAGLRSADRSNKATLPRTRPGRTLRSYAEDPAPRQGQIASRRRGARASVGRRLPTRWGARPEGLSVSVYAARGRIAALRHGF